MAVAVPAVGKDALLDVDKSDDRQLEGAVNLVKIERVGARRKLRELHEKRDAKMQNVWKSVAEPFTLTNKLFGSVTVHMSIAERASSVNGGEELKVDREAMTDEQDGSREALADLTFEHAKRRRAADAAKQLVEAQMKETREVHSHELDLLCN